MPQQRGLLSPSCRLPFRVERSIPQEGLCKGKICNHDSKAKWLLKLERTNTKTEREKTKHSCTKDLGVNFTGICRLAPHFVLGRFLHFQGGSGDRAGAAPQPRGFQACCLGLDSPCCVPRNRASSCWQHLWLLLVRDNIRLRDFLIQP